MLPRQIENVAPLLEAIPKSLGYWRGNQLDSGRKYFHV